MLHLVRHAGNGVDRLLSHRAQKPGRVRWGSGWPLPPWGCAHLRISGHLELDRGDRLLPGQVGHRPGAQGLGGEPSETPTHHQGRQHGQRPAGPSTGRDRADDGRKPGQEPPADPESARSQPGTTHAAAAIGTSRRSGCDRRRGAAWPVPEGSAPSSTRRALGVEPPSPEPPSAEPPGSKPPRSELPRSELPRRSRRDRSRPDGCDASSPPSGTASDAVRGRSHPAVRGDLRVRLRSDPRHLLKLLDPAEATVLVAPGDDLGRGHRSDAR